MFWDRKRGTRWDILTVLLILLVVVVACGGQQPAAPATGQESQEQEEAVVQPTEPPVEQVSEEATPAEEGAAEEESAAAPSGEPIVIGAYASGTGTLQVFGSFEQEGWEIAEQHLNEQGGILGRPVEIRFRDDASDKDQARAIAEEFVADEAIIGITGPTSSANAFASHPVAVEAGVPVIAISNNAQGIIEQGEVIWRISIPEERLLPVVVEQVVSTLGVERAAILYAQDDPFSQSGLLAYQNTLSEMEGVEVVAEVAYSSQTPDFGPQIRQLMEGDPQIVFAAAFAEDAGTFLRQARDAGLVVPIVGNASFNSPTQLDIAGDAANDVIIGSQWWLGDTDPLNQKFVEDYRAQFNREPGNFSAMAYNGAFLAKQALEASGDASREGLQQGLTMLEGYDILGAAVRLENRDAFTDEPIILMVQDGAFVPLDAEALQ